jgi:chorismate mutase
VRKILCFRLREFAAEDDGQGLLALQRLVEASAQRLVIAEQVALAKWDSGTPVEDTSREAQVIASGNWRSLNTNEQSGRNVSSEITDLDVWILYRGLHTTN